MFVSVFALLVVYLMFGGTVAFIKGSTSTLESKNTIVSDYDSGSITKFKSCVNIKVDSSLPGSGFINDHNNEFSFLLDEEVTYNISGDSLNLRVGSADYQYKAYANSGFKNPQ